MEDNKPNKKMLDADLEYITEGEEKLKEKLKESTHLERFTTDIVLLVSLVKDYYQGNYRNIPYKTISAVVVGLVYILNPIDMIPDFIPVVGYIDDALVIAFCLKMVEKDLKKYQVWKESQTPLKTHV
ncbi:YkvA family protein [Psychrobacter sp. CAL346-MNA-CIBAN-0220]|uniref:YkvA family protein n=1 Tax=Psychrobacter sp. CAL346-MNA-CIBAN-0220 TaxID=3140457 RepID=UPI00387E8BC2